MTYQGRSNPTNTNNNNRRVMRRRVCEFCVAGTSHVDYKDAEKLKRYVTEFGRIRPRRQTGVCAKHQRALAIAVKRSRHIALLPFVAD